MFVPLPSLTDKKGGRMNGVMNHRRGGGLQTMIMRPRNPSDKPEFILAHENAGHAEPRLNDNGKGDVVNAVEIENAIRRETNEKERKEEPEHVQ